MIFSCLPRKYERPVQKHIVNHTHKTLKTTKCSNLTIGFQISKIAVAIFATIKRCLRNSSQYGKIDTGSSHHTLIHFVVTVVERIGSSPFLQIVFAADLLRSEFLFNMNGVLCSASLFGQRFGRRSNDLCEQSICCRFI